MVLDPTGQDAFYRSLLRRSEPDRKRHLAVPHEAFSTTLAEPIARPVIEDFEISIIAFERTQQVIVARKP